LVTDLGQNNIMSALPLKAHMGGAQADVGFGPKADMCLYEPYRAVLA
jgi:hypothetical protein